MEPVFIAEFELSAAHGDVPNAKLWLTRYMEDDSWALMVTDDSDLPIMTATVNLTDQGEVPAPGYVFIKDWSENRGVMDSLIAAGLIDRPVRQVYLSFIEAYECAILFALP